LNYIKSSFWKNSWKELNRLPDEVEQNNNEEEQLEKSYDWKLMKRLLSYVKGYYVYFMAAVFFLFASTIAELAWPYLSKIAIDNYINSSKPMTLQDRFHGLIIICLIFIAIIILGFLFNYLQIYTLSFAGQKIIFKLRQQIFSHIQKLPIGYFDKNPLGRLVTRVTNDVEALNEMYTNVLVNFLKDALILIGTIVIMLKMNIKLSLIVLTVIPVILVLTVIFRIYARKVFRKVRTTLAQLNSAISENISGIRIIQIFNKQVQNLKLFKKHNEAFYKAGINEVVVFGIFRPLIDMLSALVIAIILWVGAGSVISKTIEFGVLFAFINYIAIFFQPITDLSEKYNILQSAMASSERIFMVLDTPVEDDHGKIVFDDTSGSAEIEFRNVWFAYSKEDWVLRDVSFKVLSGTTTAIVGATGAGKTSIINLLNRFYEIQKGEILVNGINIKNITKESLRKNIGMVLQDVFLFSGTIEENIRLNNLSLNGQRLEQISEYVNASAFIESLPSKYQEEVKERGATFSSGQRQLLSFARALAFDPKILILDEATASIDTETEILIQDALKNITKDRTNIVIAHRLSTIQHADNIIVLHKGKVREVGNHQRLLSNKGIYYNLYNLQYKLD
jgi:ATP-binding cassette, subfamily B, multidrug efflux pump